MALSAPQQQGDQLNQSDVEGHTLIVAPTEFIAHIPTVHTKPGEQSPAIRVNVIDLSSPDGVPVMYNGVLWFGVISTSLKRQIGETILCRMGKGQASPGKNAPWQLTDIMSEQEWVNHANAWLATPIGEQWEIANINEINRLAQQAEVSGVAQAAPAAPAPAPAPAAPRATPPPAIPPTMVSGPPAAPAASVPAGPAPASAGAIPAGLEALIASLPPEQQAAARAIAAGQAGAAS